MTVLLIAGGWLLLTFPPAVFVGRMASLNNSAPRARKAPGRVTHRGRFQ